MISKFIFFLVIVQRTFCYPQSITLPEIKDTVQPAEVNSLEQHNHRTRSIADSPAFLSHNNVEETIQEVEAMLKANPTLPRLTRGEILDLLENITKQDMTKNQLPSTNEENKERDPKAIMVVMPYTPSNGKDVNMEELFTKPPITHIVGSVPLKKTQENYTFKRIPEEIVHIPELDNKKVTEKYNKTPEKDAKLKKTPPTPITLSTSSTNAESSTPSLLTTKPTHNRRRRPPQLSANPLTATPGPTTYHPKRPIRRRPSTTERYPNHRYPDEVSTESAKTETLPSSGLKIVDPPRFDASDLNEDLQMVENRRHNLPIQQLQKEKVPEKVIINLKEDASTTSSLIDIVPDNLKGVLTDINSQTNKPLSPTTTTTTKKTPSEKEEEAEIRKMLASFGVLPIKTTSTTTQVPDISNVADNLTPDMKELLMSFGLLPATNENNIKDVSTTTEDSFGFNPVKAEVRPEAYAGFKPLPDDDSGRDDMEEFLARFGLGRNSRKEKSITKNAEDKKDLQDQAGSLNFEAVPEQYMAVLEDIGLANRQGKMIRAEPLVKTQEKQNVFNPAEPQYASTEDLEKLNKLIEVVRHLESLNGTATEEDLKKLDVNNLKELISSLNEENKILSLDHQNAPDPINFDVGLEKNEVKRQDNTTTTTTTTTSAPSTSTEEVQTANIKDLEASFGGQVDANPSTEEPVVETTTQARRTGFYYLVDWNSFLDIDDQKGKRVNLRFQPKIGDPKRFYSVSVP